MKEHMDAGGRWRWSVESRLTATYFWMSRNLWRTSGQHGRHGMEGVRDGRVRGPRGGKKQARRKRRKGMGEVEMEDAEVGRPQ